MADWHYFETDGQKRGPYSFELLVQVVLQGMITRETFLEDPHGRICPAGEVDGLPFYVTEPQSEFNQATPQPIAVPVAESNTALLWTIIIGFSLFLIVAVAGLVYLHHVYQKILFEKLTRLTEKRLISDVKDLPLEMTVINFEDKRPSVFARNASVNFTARMKATEDLYQSVSSESMLRKLGISTQYNWELNKAREKNNALPATYKVPEPRLDWPQFYDVLANKGFEVTLTGKSELACDSSNDWQVAQPLELCFSYNNKEYSKDQLHSKSGLWIGADQYTFYDPETKEIVDEIIQNREKFVDDVDEAEKKWKEDHPDDNKGGGGGGYDAFAQIRARRAEILKGAFDLKEVLKESGFWDQNRLRNWGLSYILRDYTEYGTDRLRDKLNAAKKHPDHQDPFKKAEAEARVRAVEAEIGVALAEIAKNPFLYEYTYTTSNVNVYGNESSCTIDISSGFTDRMVNAVNVSFPVPDVKVNTSSSSYESIHIAVTGSTDNIQELVKGSDKYRVRVRFKNLMLDNRNNRPAADVLELDIIKKEDALPEVPPPGLQNPQSGLEGGNQRR